MFLGSFGGCYHKRFHLHHLPAAAPSQQFLFLFTSLIRDTASILTADRCVETLNVGSFKTDPLIYLVGAPASFSVTWRPVNVPAGEMKHLCQNKDGGGDLEEADSIVY